MGAVSQAKGKHMANDTTSKSKRYRVTVREWLVHSATIEATDAAAAEAEARRMWEDNSEYEVFNFDDGGIDGVQVKEIDQGGASCRPRSISNTQL